MAAGRTTACVIAGGRQDLCDISRLLIRAGSIDWRSWRHAAVNFGSESAHVFITSSLTRPTTQPCTQQRLSVSHLGRHPLSPFHQGAGTATTGPYSGHLMSLLCQHHEVRSAAGHRDIPRDWI